MKKRNLFLILFILLLNGITRAEDKLPKAYLNRVMVVVDDVTFSGIVKSAFMSKKFANVDINLPKFTAPNDTSSALYIRGKNTYIEIHNTKYSTDRKEGQFAVVFSTEIKDAVYDSLRLANTSSLYSLDTSIIKRNIFLKKRYNADKLLNDITEISLQLSSKETLPFIELLKQLNFSVSEKNNAFVAKGNDIVIRIKTANETVPKLQLKFKMNMEKEGNYNLNNSKMEFTGTYGTWNFY